ncbi:MAG: RNA polymerase sigma-54 factor [Cytophagales bacterium]|nr:MAG: RNA polymerase sigma-54 factor [Cytophagales bacterium]
MQKIGLNQTLSQKLSPQQIQFIKLLQIPTVELRSRIEEELEINPALEEGREEEDNKQEEDNYLDDINDEYGDFSEYDDREGDSKDDYDMSLDEYMYDEDLGDYSIYSDNNGRDDDKDMPIAMTSSLMDNLLMQLSFLGLEEQEKSIGKQIIGSLDNDGYLRRKIEAIVNDIAFSQNMEVDEDDVYQVLHKIQYFDPPGIAARDLKECLMIQLRRKDDDNYANETAIRILEETFEEFTKKHYDKIQKKLSITEKELKDAVDIVTKLNPKPGDTGTDFIKQYIIPDFILTNNNNKLELSLNSRNAPELKINRKYAEMLDAYAKAQTKKDKNAKEAITFVKQKIDAAKWFIDAIKQRQQTLLRTMNAIIEYQYEFFLDGDESKFKPMILKHIADKIDMDISTISRVANSKSIQTDFGIFPLKYFFSEGISTDTGEDVSSREVKNTLKEMVDKEDKRKPLSDDKLEKLLQQKGYKIARRTVAKYREQLNIPVARLRKEL